jgi:gamma-glutamylcyclotransferase (GGCT)/AIG2-like uncharacterized protein YtfP
MSNPSGPSEKLFSYGSLQNEPVQLATFGRKLHGSADSLPKYRLELLAIGDPAVVALSGASHHPIVIATGDAADRVTGMVFEITPEELRHADDYEVADYRRIEATLASGSRAWVYVKAEA